MNIYCKDMESDLFVSIEKVCVCVRFYFGVHITSVVFLFRLSKIAF